MKRRTIIATVTVGILALTGCAATFDKEDALHVPGSVIEITDASFGTVSTFGYVGNDGSITLLDDCARGFFAPNHCDSADGTYHFEWKTRKGRVKNATITVDGSTDYLTCRRDSSGSRLYICIPTDNLIEVTEKG